jgi:5'-nucleotidase
VRTWRRSALLAAALIGTLSAAPVGATPEHPAAGTPAEPTTDVHLLAFNDLHGTLEAGSLTSYGKFAGGAAYLAKAIEDRQATYGHHQATVMAGDNIGASPLANGLFFEEPITIATNLMHVDAAAVGNHEFDKGRDELLRIQDGGCRPVEGCTAAPYAQPDGSSTDTFPGADFPYLAANVVDDATGRPLLPATATKEFTSGSSTTFKVGFIGEVLKDTPTIVTPSGVAGLTFLDEAQPANGAAAALAAEGVKVPVLVIHQGGNQTGAGELNACDGGLAGSPIEEIAQHLDPSIKVIVSGHTHAEYNCTITANGVTRLVTSAASFGRVLTDITLTVDDATGELISAAARNEVVENALNTPGPNIARQPDPTREDPQVKAIVDQYVAAAAPLADRVIGRTQGDLTRTGSPRANRRSAT